jgi:hypothetical protein
MDKENLDDWEDDGRIVFEMEQAYHEVDDDDDWPAVLTYLW